MATRVQRRTSFKRRSPRYQWKRRPPLKVEDLNVQSTHDVDYNVAMTAGSPTISLIPVLGLASLLGSSTSTEYSQTQPYRRTLVGRVKFMVDILLIGHAAVFANDDQATIACGWIVASADDVDGTPGLWFSTGTNPWNPFRADVMPLATEARKNPYGTEEPRLLAWRKWTKVAYDPSQTNNAWQRTCRWTGKLPQRSFVIRETQMLYFFHAFHHSIQSPGVTTRKLDLHAGVPHRFLRR